MGKWTSEPVGDYFAGPDHTLPTGGTARFFEVLNQDIFLLVANFNNQAQQLEIAEEADQIAEKRYKTSVETFMIGKISTLDLNDAQNSKDEARQKHISELYYYWYYFYQLRSLTLWDFERNMELEADFEDIIKG